MRTINVDIPNYGIKCAMNLHVAAYLPADARPTYITIIIICMYIYVIKRFVLYIAYIS